MDPFIIAIAAFTALLWTVICAHRMAQQGTGTFPLVMSVLLLGICFGHPFFHVSLGPIPVTLDRLLLFAVLLFVVCQRTRDVLASKEVDATTGKSTYDLRRFMQPCSKMEWCLVALVGWLLVSTLMHNWKQGGAAPLAIWLFFWAQPLALYFLAREVPATKKHLRFLFLGAAVLGVYLAFTGIAEVKGINALIFPKYIASPQYEEFFGRARGPLLNPIGNGILLTLGAAGLVMAWPRVGRFGQLGIIACGALISLGAYYTLTRSVWLGFALAAVTVAALSFPKQWRLPLGVAVCLLGVGLVAAKWDSLNSFKRDKNVSVDDMADSASLRPILAVVAWKMFQDKPIAGCGFGQYRTASVDYLYDRDVDLPLEKARPYVQHNVFLALLTETGLIGLLLFVATMCWMATDAWKLWRGSGTLCQRQLGLLQIALLVSWLPNSMFHDCTLIPMLNMTIFCTAGLVRQQHFALAGNIPEPLPAIERNQRWQGSPA
jgi:O-antigen ligase